MKPTRFFPDLFLTHRFFAAWLVVVLLFIFSFLFSFLLPITFAVAAFLGFVSLLDIIMLFAGKGALQLTRETNSLYSNTDPNGVTIHVQNSFQLPLQLDLIDEIPSQFQVRNFKLNRKLAPREGCNFQFTLTPHERGEYHFGHIHAYIRTFISFAERRFTASQEQVVKVYPSFLQLKNVQLEMVNSNPITQLGQHKFKRGSSAEFDHVKEYNRGDDFRRINWKASARKNDLMVNSYMDEKSQQVYCLIDKGRLMKMPFQHTTLLDYAINASLHFSYVALHKEDKAGIITFGEKVDDIAAAAKSGKQLRRIMEVLYKQETQFLESNFADLCGMVRKKLGQRSLLMLFTNFETLIGFERQLPYFRMMNEKHLLCVVFFENTEVATIEQKRGDSLGDIYIKTIAERFMQDKRQMVAALKKAGIIALLCPPHQLSVHVVNKYLELKSKHSI